MLVLLHAVLALGTHTTPWMMLLETSANWHLRSFSTLLVLHRVDCLLLAWCSILELHVSRDRPNAYIWLWNIVNNWALIIETATTMLLHHLGSLSNLSDGLQLLVEHLSELFLLLELSWLVRCSFWARMDLIVQFVYVRHCYLNIAYDVSHLLFMHQLFFHLLLFDGGAAILMGTLPCLSFSL